MAGKKKKKPAANPARGFATTSLPSKPKHPDEVNVQTNAEHNPENAQDAKVHARSISISQGEIPSVVAPGEMNPEQYEAYLGRVELENLVTSSAARVKLEAQKQATKLQNELRLLRQSAEPASISFLTDDVVRDILSDVSLHSEHITAHETNKSDAAIDQDQMLLRLWALDQTLNLLKLPAIQDVLLWVAKLWYRVGMHPTGDYIPGLPDAIKWYAFYNVADSLPTVGSFGGDACGVDEEFTDLVLADDGVPADDTLKDIGHPSSGQVTASVDSAEIKSDDDPGDADLSDIQDQNHDDDDPATMIDRWLILQSQKYRRTQRTTKVNGKIRNDLKKIDTHITEIERDVLFDNNLAQQRWQPVLRDLQIEFGRSRKKDRAMMTSQKRSDAVTEDQLALDNGDDLLGGIFGDEPDNDDCTRAENESTIYIEDFGAWSGVHPRKLLEEVASSLLSQHGLKFKKLSTTSFSSRIEMSVKWSKTLALNLFGLKQLYPGIIVKFTRTLCLLKMETIATPSIQQSEAMLATLVIYLLISNKEINSKVTQRLPKVWRDLVAKLELRTSENIAKMDVDRLEELRKLLRNATEVNGTQSIAKERHLETYEDPRRTRSQIVRLPADVVLQMWSRRKTSTAFTEMYKFREQLPVFSYKQRILEAFVHNQVLIVCADTGAGKSTQIPSYLLEAQLSSGKDYHILVTQPRRISAISIARRVSAELGEDPSAVGTVRSLIGYAIRLESKTSQNTRITFATTGVLLRMLQDAPDLDTLDCLVLDEVHERTMDLDLLFVALKQLQKRRPELKVVLMSATVDATKFSRYFDDAPVLDIPGRTFPVEVGFLEDALEETLDVRAATSAGYQSQPESVETSEHEEQDDLADSNVISDKYSPSVRKALAQYDYLKLDYDLILRLTVAIATKPRLAHYSSAILIFMPGIAEIRRLHNLFRSSTTFASDWRIHMLHSSFTTNDLEEAFVVPPKGVRKIVIATNIAETGITIPDVTAVIDTCKEKVMRFDERRQLSRLTEAFIARASARQRKGRAARVQEGLCFHLIPRYYFETKMTEQPTPEMLRLSLQEPVLRIKIWNLGQAEEVLSAAIDPPSTKNIRRAISKLQDGGAIDASENLTMLGKVLAKLPLDVAFGKMAVFGVIFHCLDAIVTIIASFSVKSIFIEKNGTSTSAYASFSKGESDFVTFYNAYTGWKKAFQTGNGHQYCQKYNLSHSQLLQVEEQKAQLFVYIVDAGLVKLCNSEVDLLRKARSERARGTAFQVPARYNRLASDAVICATVAVALYPKLLRRENQSYRNVHTNQHLQLGPTSINRVNTSKPPLWLVYLEATQARNGKLNAFHSSKVTQAMLAVLLGTADFKFHAEIIELDHGRIRISCRGWRAMLALQHLRLQIERITNDFLRYPTTFPSSPDIRWLDLLTICLDGRSPS